jgi:NAD(P)-dependent dehydrogenase (short-subunit alcohol dehydrogenase family)
MTADFSIAGKSIFLTGAAGLLGQQWTAALTDAGATVHPLDLVGVEHPTDVTNPWQITDALWRNGTPDALICAAGLDAKPVNEESGIRPFAQQPLSAWDEVVRVNLTGTMLSCQLIGQAMVRRGHGGSIVLVSSMYALVAPDQRRYPPDFEKPAAYSATKAALGGLARWLAAYWGPSGVRVNVVCFGAMGQDSHPEGFRQSIEAAVPLRRMARAGEWDGTIQWLLSDASSYVTGATIVVDGGYTIL